MNRIHYLDWLRANAALAIVGFHAVLPFGKDLVPWYIQNVQTSETLGTVDAVLMFGSGTVPHGLARASP